MSSNVYDEAKAFINEHLCIYRETDGAEGHIMDLTAQGAKANTTCMLLKAVGRKSGTDQTVPLIYGKFGDEYILVASKGGADENPAWFYNLTARPEIDFQVGREHLHGTWRIVEGEERAKLWDFMVDVYPIYTSYKSFTDREIPVVALKPVG